MLVRVGGREGSRDTVDGCVWCVLYAKCIVPLSTNTGVHKCVCVCWTFAIHPISPNSPTDLIVVFSIDTAKPLEVAKYKCSPFPLLEGIMLYSFSILTASFRHVPTHAICIVWDWPVETNLCGLHASALTYI